MTENSYAKILKEQGSYVINVDGIYWYDYGGFMIPAYLPHRCPKVNSEMAKKVVKESGRAFARWDTKFGELDNSEWWYILKRGPWSLENIKSKKKRWMIRQGKHLVENT